MQKTTQAKQKLEYYLTVAITAFDKGNYNECNRLLNECIICLEPFIKSHQNASVKIFEDINKIKSNLVEAPAF